METTRTNPCLSCNAKCCRYVALEIDKPETKEDIENIRWYLLHENIIVYIDHDDSWIIEFQTRCKALDENNRCKIYPRRPTICREYDPSECELNSGQPWKIVFRNVEEFEKYIGYSV